MRPSKLDKVTWFCTFEQIKALNKHMPCFILSLCSKMMHVAGGSLITIVSKWKLDLVWETAGWDQTAWFIMVIYVPCSWDSAGGKGMVFTKYISPCLVSPQLGLQPVFQMNIFHMDTENTSSQCFDHPQNNKCRSLCSCAKKWGSSFYWCVRLHTVWVTSSLVTDPQIPSNSIT